MEKQDTSKEEGLVIEKSSSSDPSKEKVNDMLRNKNVGTVEEYCRCCNSSSCVERLRTLLDRDLEQRQLQVCCKKKIDLIPN